jgi:hypothetical protein
MSTAIRQGQQYTAVAVRAIYDPLRGGQIVIDYEGTATGINALIATLYSYERYEIGTSDPPIYRITVYTPDPADAPVWELLANLKEKDIFEHPDSKAISVANINKLIKWTKSSDPTTEPSFTADGTQTAATNLYNLVRNGTRKYFTEEYVLRYTLTATNAVQLNLAYANTDKIFTPAQLANPGTSGITLPAGISASIGNIPAKTAPSNWVWGWLKRAPTARQTSLGKVVITGEWWLDLWSTFVYQAMP